MSFPAVDPTGRREVVGGMEVDDEPSEIRGLSRPTPGSPRVGSVYSDTGAFTTTPGAYEPESKRTRASRADSLRAARRDRPSSTSSGRLGDPLLGGPRTSRAPSTWSERGRQTWRSRASTIASQIFMGLAALDPRKDGSIHKESLGEAESYDTLDYDRCENQVKYHLLFFGFLFFCFSCFTRKNDKPLTQINNTFCPCRCTWRRRRCFPRHLWCGTTCGSGF